MKIYSELEVALLEKFTTAGLPTATEGRIVYDTTTGTVKVGNGSTWDEVGTGGGTGTGDKLETTPSTYVAAITSGEAIAIRDAVCLDLDSAGNYRVFKADSKKPNRRNCIGFATAAATATPHIQTLTLSAAFVASNTFTPTINGRALSAITYASSSDATLQAFATAIAPAHVQTFTLGGALVASNVVSYKINGTSYSTTYASSSDATLQAIATQIASHSGIASATVTVVGGNQTGTDDRVITITGSDAKEYRFTNISITGGASQTTVTMATTTYWSPDIASATVTVVGGNQTGTDDRVITVTGQGALPITFGGLTVTGGASQPTITAATTQSAAGDAVSVLRDGPLTGFSGFTAGNMMFVDVVPGNIVAAPSDTMPILVGQAVASDTMWAFPISRPFATPAVFINAHGASNSTVATSTAERWNYSSWAADTSDSVAGNSGGNGESQFTAIGKMTWGDYDNSSSVLTSGQREYNKSSWSAGVAKGSTIGNMACGQLGNNFLQACGYNGGAQNALFIYTGTSWSTPGNMTSRYGPVGFSTGTKFHSVGGYNSGYQSANESWNGSAITTETAVTSAALYAIGGTSGSGKGSVGCPGGNSTTSYQWNGTAWGSSIPTAAAVNNGGAGDPWWGADGYNSASNLLFANGGASSATVSVSTSQQFNGNAWSVATSSITAKTRPTGAVL